MGQLQSSDKDESLPALELTNETAIFDKCDRQRSRSAVHPIGSSGKDESLPASGIINKTVSNLHTNPATFHTCDRERGSSAVHRAIHPVSSSSSDLNPVFRNQIQKPKPLGTNGRSWSNPSKTSSGISVSHHRSPLPSPSTKTLHNSLSDLEIEFNRRLSDPVRKPVFRTPDVIQSKSRSFSAGKPSSTDPLTSSSPLGSELTYYTTSNDTPYGNNHNVYEEWDDTNRSLSQSFTCSDYELKDDKSVERQWSSDNSKEEVRNPLYNNHDRVDGYGAHSGSSTVKLHRLDDSIGDDKTEASFSSFFVKKKESRLRRWFKCMRRRINFFDFGDNNKGVKIQRSGGRLT